MPGAPREIHLFVLWPNALASRDEILTDLAREFVIREVVEVHWTIERFGENLERLYSTKLPPSSGKMRHCGVGPFLAVVVEDERPAYAERRTTSGSMASVNARTFDARARYRSWTGGGHRVHSTLTLPEADRDLFLVLGRRVMSYAAGIGEAWDGTVRTHEEDVVGTGGSWSAHDLFDALDVATDYVVASSADALTRVADESDADETPPGCGGVPTILVGDIWEAHFVTQGKARGRHFTYARVRASVEGRPVVLHLRQMGSGYLDASWEVAIARGASRDAEGGRVAAPVDRFYVRLYESLVHGLLLGEGELVAVAELARAEGLPAGDYRNAAFARGVLDRHLAAHGYTYAVPVDRPADVAPRRTTETLSRITQRGLRPGRRLWSRAHRMIHGLTRRGC
jgi:hypothetical protein